MTFGDFFLVEGFSSQGGLLCPVDEPAGEDDLCEDGKPRALTFQYTGEDCSATSHNQDEDKVQCDGDPEFMNTVRIVAMDRANPNQCGAKIWFVGEVSLNEAFELNVGNAEEHKLRSQTFVFVFDLEGNLLQTVGFHTSCSQELGQDDQFGSLQLIGFTADH
mgnify:CR=1 FL=1